jgi:hypothetical protein
VPGNGSRSATARYRVSPLRKLAEELRVDPDAMTHRVDDFARQLSDHVSEVKQRMTDEGIAHPIIARLADALTARPIACKEILHSS